MSTTVAEETEHRRATQNEKGWSFTRVYKVTSSVDIDEFAATAAVGVPVIGEGHPRFSLSRVKTKSGEPWDGSQGDLQHWRVTVSYETDDKEDDEEAVHPLDREPEVSWSSTTFTKVVDKDVKTGDAILNSAGVQMNPLPEVDDARPLVRISINKAYFSANEIVEFCNHVNSDPFMGAEAGKAKVASISATRVVEVFEEKTVVYWRCEYEIHFSKDGWKHVQLDQGFMERIDGELQRIVKKGEPVPEEVLLDGEGLELTDDADPVFLEFDVFYEAGFAKLDLRV